MVCHTVDKISFHSRRQFKWFGPTVIVLLSFCSSPLPRDFHWAWLPLSLGIQHQYKTIPFNSKKPYYVNYCANNSMFCQQGHFCGYGLGFPISLVISSISLYFYLACQKSSYPHALLFFLIKYFQIMPYAVEMISYMSSNIEEQIQSNMYLKFNLIVERFFFLFFLQFVCSWPNMQKE